MTPTTFLLIVAAAAGGAFIGGLAGIYMGAQLAISCIGEWAASALKEETLRAAATKLRAEGRL